MRKLLSKALVLAAMTALFLTATAAAAQTGVVNADALRVRTEPSTDASTVTHLNSGDQVQVLENLGDWYQISVGGVTGYVSAEYLTCAGEAVTETPVPLAAAPSAAGQTGVIIGSTVNYRSGPSTDHEVLATVAEGTEMTIVLVENGWCQMDWNGVAGYVSADYVSVNGIPLVDPQGIVTGSCVNVRSAPSTEAGIVTKVYAGTLVDLIALEGDWYTVSYNGAVGYIRNDYLRVYDGSTSTIGSSIVDTALSYLGTPYVYGGASSSGFDCSGFTMYVFGLHGYSLPHSATSQWYNSGTYVERSDLQPGDLVLFCDPSRSNGKACSHVGIYIGNNEFVHASSGSSGKYVRTSSLDESYYNSYYVGAKRVG